MLYDQQTVLQSKKWFRKAQLPNQTNQSIFWKARDFPSRMVQWFRKRYVTRIAKQATPLGTLKPHTHSILKQTHQCTVGKHTVPTLNTESCIIFCMAKKYGVFLPHIQPSQKGFAKNTVNMLLLATMCQRFPTASVPDRSPDQLYHKGFEKSNRGTYRRGDKFKQVFLPGLTRSRGD